MCAAIYMDYNASAPLAEGVGAAVVAAMDLVGNPSSVHGPGRAARALVDRARRSVAALIGADTERLIFTSGGTEANNLALTGGDRVYVSAAEHASVLDAAPAAHRLPVDENGVLDLAALDGALKEAPGALVSVMSANNETGVIQPIADIARIVHDRGGLLHCDAVQTAGRLAFDMAALGCDLVTLSAHKFGGPKGVGALAVGPGVPLTALIKGGGQEKYRRAGTENLPGIAGMGAAAEYALDHPWQSPQIAQKRDRLEAALKQIAPDAVVHGADAARLANTSNIALNGISGETQVMAMDLAGIAVSSGSACSSGKVTPSHVLAAMRSPLGANALRISIGPETTDAQIDRLIAAYRRMVERKRTRQTLKPELVPEPAMVQIG